MCEGHQSTNALRPEGLRSASWYCKHPACMHSTAHLTPCAPRAVAAAAWGTHLDAATGLPPHLATPALSTQGTPHPSYHYHQLLHHRSALCSSTQEPSTAIPSQPLLFQGHSFSPYSLLLFSSGITTFIIWRLRRLHFIEIPYLSIQSVKAPYPSVKLFVYLRRYMCIWDMRNFN